MQGLWATSCWFWRKYKGRNRFPSRNPMQHPRKTLENEARWWYVNNFSSAISNIFAPAYEPTMNNHPYMNILPLTSQGLNIFKRSFNFNNNFSLPLKQRRLPKKNSVKVVLIRPESYGMYLSDANYICWWLISFIGKNIQGEKTAW